MKKRIALLCVSLLVSSLLRATPPDAGWQSAGPSVLVALDVDAAGHVVHAELVRQGSVPQFQELARQTTKNWSFAPATIDGKPVPARTFVVLEPEMRKNGDQISLRFRYASHGPGQISGQPPHLTPDMAYRHIEAKIVIDATVGTDGTYQDVRTEIVEISNKKFDKELSLAIEKTMSTWRALPETVNGQAIATRVRLPYSFSIVATDTTVLPIGFSPASSGSYNHGNESPHAPDSSVTNHETESKDLGSSTLVDQPVAVDSALKLISTPP